MKNKDGGYVLPEIIDPERICIQIYVPNERYHLLAFWAQIEELGSALQWHNDPAHTALPVSAVWRDVYSIARTQYYEGGCMTDPCCPETNEQLEKLNFTVSTIMEMLKGGATISFNAQAAPSDFTVDCTPDEFTGNEGETPIEKIKRQNALCLAVNRWLVSILGNRADKMNQTSKLNDIWALGGFTAPPKMYAQIQYVEFAFTVANLNTIIDDETAFQLVACAIIQALANEGNTFSIFKKLIGEVYDEIAAGEEVAQTLVALVAKNYATDRVNYTLFSKELERAYEDIVDGDDYSCLCFGGVCDVAEFSIISMDDSTVEHLTDPTWRFTQNTFTINEADVQIFSIKFRDEFWRCFNHTGTTPYSGSSWKQYDCDGVYSEGTGGSGGLVVQEEMIVAFPSGSHITAPLVQTITIACP